MLILPPFVWEKKFKSLNEAFSFPLNKYCCLFLIFIGLIAAILDIDSLVEMLSIGTLLAYTIVDICILILRYKDFNKNGNEQLWTIKQILPRFSVFLEMDFFHPLRAKPLSEKVFTLCNF